ncbi:4'-phosphopantetheinyl transferase superfamily protein [Pseudoalteromonas sp. APC 3224]|uniref:4'-phosphopantetheinyl transferase family protein n=1 Tax=Pseudoalteromonas sp. APC 3224 TaxID=3035203 RepID=UPI0025B3DCBB|nr:4'-phosphopantetheinyl transferase superfamily protein [Pseudoalteromonas sp. APC 3224]MDN3483780.1 4'-phosphopantetheinyl transferase superfamily protein [Pseudoalteromonas sp. APC 3224]
MLLQNFIHKQSNEYNSTDFITETEIWEHISLPIRLVTCKFDIHNFSPEYFECFDVPFEPTISKAVPKRQAEFLAGRLAAAEALKVIGAPIPLKSIKASQNKGPQWPNEVAGSISHTNDIAAAIVGPSSIISSLGIDIEEHIEESVCIQIAKQIHNEDEISLFINKGIESNKATTILFSAKEALYKALYKYVNCFFGFEIAQAINLDLKHNILELKLEESFRSKYKLHQTYFCHFHQVHSIVISLITVAR